MKYLKKFNESSNLEQTSLNLKQTILDIFLDLTDDGYKISIQTPKSPTQVESSRVNKLHPNYGDKITLIISLEKVESNYENILGRTFSNVPFIFSECIDNFDRVYDYASSYGDVVTNQVGALLNNIVDVITPISHSVFSYGPNHPSRTIKDNNWGSFKDKLINEYGLDTLVRFLTINLTIVLDT